MICHQELTNTFSEKKQRTNIFLVFKNIYKLKVQNCFCLLHLVCPKCCYKLDKAVIDRNRLKHSWETLRIVNQLPVTVHTDFEACAKCTVFSDNLPVPPVDPSSYSESSAQDTNSNDELGRMLHLRHNLEQARLLCDQVRKREILKRQLVFATVDIKILELNSASDQTYSSEESYPPSHDVQKNNKVQDPLVSPSSQRDASEHVYSLEESSVSSHDGQKDEKVQKLTASPSRQCDKVI